MDKILKYEIPIGMRQFNLPLPDGFEILHLGLQNHKPMLWVRVKTEDVTRPTDFFVYGTGEPIGAIPSLYFVGTFQQPPFVWHVFQYRPDVLK